MGNASEKTFSFGNFELDAGRRRLLKEGEIIALNSKSFDLLLTLIENHGQILSKDELLEKVWEGQFVEENNLSVQIAALRKIFGERKGEHQFIATIPGKGYRFVAALDEPARAGEIIVENRSFSRIVIEEELAANGHAAAQISAGKISKSRTVLLAALAVGGLLCGLAGYRFYQKYNERQNRAAAAWSDSALSVIEAQQLTSNGKVESAALSPDGNYFAFVNVQAEERSLWFGQTDGSRQMQIRPPEKVRYSGLTFAPDGRQIYYAASGEQIPRGALFRLPTLGGVPQKVLENIRSTVAFSPDGKQIAFTRVDAERKLSVLVVADAETGVNERELAARPSGLAFSPHGAAWSPDGKTIAVGAEKENSGMDGEILLVDAADGKIATFGSNEWNSIRRVAWLKDGSALLANVIENDTWDDRHVWLLEYPSGEARKITRDLYRYGATSLGVSDDNSRIIAVREQSVSNIYVGAVSDLKNQKQITANSMGRRDGARGLAWTANGRIVYSTMFNRSRTLWTMDASGADPRQLTPNGFLDRHTSVSKDGRFVFFDSLRNGVWNIQRVAADGGDERQITVDGGVRPAVTRDGKWIFYTGKHSDGYDSIWKVAADGGEPARVLEKSADWTSIAPDGTRFACVYRPAGEKARLAIFPIEGGEPLLQFDFPAAASFGYLRWMPDGQSIIYHNAGTDLWRQKLTGGEPEKILELPERIIFSFDLSPDGQQFAIAHGERVRDAVLLTNR